MCWRKPAWLKGCKSNPQLAPHQSLLAADAALRSATKQFPFRCGVPFWHMVYIGLTYCISVSSWLSGCAFLYLLHNIAIEGLTLGGVVFFIVESS